jgi:DNA polymerase elongation subunit (family B)
MDFENATLFGHDPQEGIVAVDFDGARTALLFVRQADGFTRIEPHAFQPYFWTASGAPDSIPLDGTHPLSALRKFEDWPAFQSARTAKSGAPVFALNDPVQQFLTATGKTLFKGMLFESLRRMQIHLEVALAENSPHADAARDPISLIALSDATGWEEILRVEAGSVESERAALERLQAIIEERDPDVIEGHQLFKFTLPFLAERARRFKSRLRWGRDGSPLAARSSRLQIAEKTIQYTRFTARGRHFVDTFLLAQYYDVGTRELENFSLRSVAEHFGVTEPGEAQATRALAAILSASYFPQAQIFPYNYQDVIVRGNATKIDALFLREYLRRGHSLPEMPETRAFEGGYTDIFFTGVARDVWHCDVASLYPSVMLRFDMLPENDTLGVFRGLLTDLRAFRMAAKQRMRDAAAEPERRHFSALQNTFKILINSFYGYLGFAQGHFADFDAAAAVTAKGRELLRAMVEWLRNEGAQVIEIDTDGIYFQPPAGATVEMLDAGIRKILPDGIEVEFDAQYAAMFSYKAKNYALLGRDGDLTLKGAALKSRGMEPYLREFLERIVRFILEENPAAVHRLREEFEMAIRAGAWPIERLARTESLQDSPGSYQKKIAASSRNRSAAFELALASGRDYQAGDAISYYITGAKKKVVAYEAARMAAGWNPAQRDENVEYYVAKLNELSLKFEEFAPRPGAPAAPASAQTSLAL